MNKFVLSEDELAVIENRTRKQGRHKIWTGATNSLGYPYFWHGGKAVLLGRFLWQMENRELKRYEKLHHCREHKLCVNARHFRVMNPLEVKSLVDRFRVWVPEQRRPGGAR